MTPDPTACPMNPDTLRTALSALLAKHPTEGAWDSSCFLCAATTPCGRIPHAADCPFTLAREALAAPVAGPKAQLVVIYEDDGTEGEEGQLITVRCDKFDPAGAMDCELHGPGIAKNMKISRIYCIRAEIVPAPVTPPSDLVRRLQNHIAMMDSHQKAREQGGLLIEALEALRGAPEPCHDCAELESIREYLWPNQTGLPNKHRNCLVAIQAREQLLREKAERLAVPVAGQVAYVPLEPGDIITDDAVQLLSLKGPFPMKEWSPSSIGQPYNPGKWTWAVCRPITIPQSAPVGDERASFEAAFPNAEFRRSREFPDRYVVHEIQHLWTGWQARAALDRSGWIALSERKPTVADGDRWGRVMWWPHEDSPFIGPVWNDYPDATHWQPLPPPPATEAIPGVPNGLSRACDIMPHLPTIIDPAFTAAMDEISGKPEAPEVPEGRGES